MAVVESARPSATLDSASVERVAAFLTHESTQSTPLSERIAFLRQKGISSDDIAAALRKTGLSQPSAATATSEVASSSPPWASRLATVLAVVASGAALIRTSATANAAKATATTAAATAAAAAEGTASVHAQLDELAELSKELFARHAATTSAASATASAAAQEAASVRAELVALTTGTADEDLQMAKNQLKYNLMLQMDGTSAKTEEIGRHMLAYGRRISLAETFARIDEIEPADEQRVTEKVIWDQEIAFAGMGPNLTYVFDINGLRRGTFWNRL